jgi:hypothetical protein
VVLGKVGLAPTTEVGNIIPALRLGVAAQLHIPVQQVQVLCIGHNQAVHRLRGVILYVWEQTLATYADARASSGVGASHPLAWSQYW